MIKKFHQIHESSEGKSTESILREIIVELESEKEDSDNPSGYLEEEYYIKCGGRSSAYENAIDIIKRYLGNL